MIQPSLIDSLRTHNGKKWDNFNYFSKAFFELANNGIVVPYADAIIYHNKGIILGGGSGSGKSSLADLLVKGEPESRVISNDSPTIYQNPEGKTYLVYNDGKTNQFECDFNGLLFNPPKLIPLKAIIFLGCREKGSHLGECNLSELYGWIFPFASDDHKNDELRIRCYDKILGHVPRCRAFQYDTLQERAKAIKEYLDKQ
jgi:hypothetical protein